LKNKEKCAVRAAKYARYNRSSRSTGLSAS
jgi:hypothetical protein